MSDQPITTFQVSLCYWCYAFTPPEDQKCDEPAFARLALLNGLAVELVPLNQVPYFRSRGIAIAAHLPELSTGDPAFRVGLCSEQRVVENVVLPAYRKAIETAAAGEKVIVFTGVLPAESPVDSDRCVANLRNIARYAEGRGVTLVLEHLNNKGEYEDDMRGHAGYRGYDLDWVANVVRQVDSPAARLLLDCYHVEVMHPGRVDELLRKHAGIIGHVHAAGVLNGKPSRVELHVPGQEIDYERVAATLADIGYEGCVGLEYLVSADIRVSDGIDKAIALLIP